MEKYLSYNMFVGNAGPLVGATTTAITPPHSVFLSNLTEYTNSTEIFNSLCVTRETWRPSAFLPATVATCLSINNELYYCDNRLGGGGAAFFI